TQAELIFTCIGYEPATFEITKIPGKTIEFQLRPKSYMLGEVDISARKYSFLFKDKDYSVFDYEISGDNLVLLVFKNQLKQSELVLLARNGDTLAISPLPEVPPAKLFKDFLANVHYLSKSEKAYQVFYDEQNSRIAFFHGKPLDSLLVFVKPFIFKIEERLYFQEPLAGGFGTAFGFYKKGSGKKYIKHVLNEKKLTEMGDDQMFYQNWNGNIGEENYFSKPSEYNEPPEFNFSSGFSSGKHFEENEARAHQVEFYKMIYPVFNIGENKIAFFNFACDTIEVLNLDGNILHSTPITFHEKQSAEADTTGPFKLSNADWRWGSKIMMDDYSREIYTVFLKNGMVKVQKVNPETGKLNNGTILPFPFPEKIQIYKGDAYFLVKSDGSNDKWKLVKCKI
ncbi:MAG: hypothetical protein WCK09_22575, partial [Bacteroidota bacterium]